MPKRQSNAVRKVQIIEAAGKIIHREGSEKLTVKAIAKEVGISEAAIYRHFKNKKDILVFLTKNVAETFKDDFKEVKTSKENSLMVLEEGLFAHIKAIERRKGISFQVLFEIASFGDKELNSQASRALAQYVDAISSLLDRAILQKSVKANLDVRLLAFSISCLVQGLVNNWVLNNYQTDMAGEFASIWEIIKKRISF